MGMLRLTLALAVLLAHLPGAPFTFVHGGLAVQAFFIISGFYMALVLDGKYADRGLFYSNRLLRLAPSYLAMMVVCAIGLFGFGVSVTATPEVFMTAFSDPATAVVMAFENVFVVGQELLFWLRIGPDGGLIYDPSGALPSETNTLAWQALLVPQSWSLSMELMFYAMAPFLARMRWTTLLVIALASVALRFAGHLLPLDYPLWSSRLFPTALFMFLMGMLAHRALPWASKAPRWMGAVLGLALVAGLVLMPLTGLRGEAARWLVYVGVAVVTPFAFNAFKAVKWDRWIGELSYPLYLCHLFVIALALTVTPEQAVPVAIVGSIAMSVLLVMLIEQPVDRWRQARVQRRLATLENPPVF
ncbi:acyltransferase [Brevundimonas sp. 2R-24]|uniref:Acyltransferase n=1 Tax=Peiella sedimenti TaxID=3061083 RepID=A0ABT8SL18_9CAUL|nr:acyltransferase [Caulobacteraceae bacterium XZ-24]